MFQNIKEVCLVRDIKFRAWDKALNRMLVWDELMSHPPHMWLYEGVMQYTGRKDTNGTEIYEDDFIVYLYEHGMPNMKTKKMVKWMEHPKYSGWNFGNSSRFLVIGNVWQGDIKPFPKVKRTFTVRSLLQIP